MLFDTHTLLYWVDAKARLSRAQRRAIDRAAKQGELWVSEISFWEVASLLERGRIDLGPLPIDEWLERATAEPLVQRCGLTPAIAREIVSLTATRGWDPADRILVATARLLQATLATNDERIGASALVSVV